MFSDLFAFEFQIKYVFDILVVAFLMYEAFMLLRRSGAVNLFWGILAFSIVWFLVKFVFQLDLTSAILDRVVSVGAIALIVIFQEEIRTFFYRIGSRFRTLQIRRAHDSASAHTRLVQQIVVACQHMSLSHTGALIVLGDASELKKYADTGERVDAIVSSRMIENIFFKNTPLHDGALLISGGRLHSAGCILPVSKDLSIPQHYGLRHRAALGLSEVSSNAFTIIVSEETGRISVARDGQISETTDEALFRDLTAILSGSAAGAAVVG